MQRFPFQSPVCLFGSGSHLSPALRIGLNARGVVYWLDHLVERAENHVHDNSAQVNPEQVLEGVARLEVQERVLLHSGGQVEGPYDAAVEDGQVGDEFPVLFPEDAVGAEYVDDGGAGGH